jgi:hypothetical protein
LLANTLNENEIIGGNGMIPTIIIQIALIIILVRSVYVVVQKINTSHKAWLDILFHASIAIVALNFLLV